MYYLYTSTISSYFLLQHHVYDSTLKYTLHILRHFLSIDFGDRRRRDRMVGGFTTTFAIGTYHH